MKYTMNAKITTPKSINFIINKKSGSNIFTTKHFFKNSKLILI